MDRGTWWAIVHGVAESDTIAMDRGTWWATVHGLQRVRHDPHGQRNLVGYSPWGRTESDTTKQLSTHMYIPHFIYPFIHQRTLGSLPHLVEYFHVP